MIENWKDTAFGSDFGGDFLNFIEQISDQEITMEMIYQNTDIKKYLDEPELLKKRNDNNVNFTKSAFEQYIHFEDIIIGLSAIIVESKLNGKLDLTKAYGSKSLYFTVSTEEITPVCRALKNIYNTPDNYVLFEMCLEKEREETLKDIEQIVNELEKIIA